MAKLQSLLHLNLLFIIIHITACQSLPAQPHLLQKQSHDFNQSANSKQNISQSQDDIQQIITHAKQHNQNQVYTSAYYPIITGADAFTSRSVLTQMANKKIDAQYYIWHNDQTGQIMLKQLWEAANRGVKVRLLLDDFNNSRSLDQQLLRFAKHPNIQVRLVNPMSQRTLKTFNYLTGLPHINRRMHNKSMTFDGQISIIGGRNIGDEYLNNNAENQFADLDVMLIGNVVQDIESSFENYWQSPLSFDIQTLVKAPYYKKQKNFLSGLNKLPKQPHNINISQQKIDLTIENNFFNKSTNLYQELIHKNIPFHWTTVQFLVDDVKKLTKTAKKESLLLYQLRQQLGTPKQQFTIISSYFIPTKNGVNSLIKLAKSGVRIKILTNSFHATDVTAVHAIYSKSRIALLKAGVEIYELKSTANLEYRENKLWRTKTHSATSLHAKAFAIDNDKTFIGSYNVDPRSANINTELGVIIQDPSLTQHFHQAVDSDLLSQAYQVTLSTNNQLQWQTLENGKLVIYHSEPEINTINHIWINTLANLPIDWLF